MYKCGRSKSIFVYSANRIRYTRSRPNRLIPISRRSFWVAAWPYPQLLRSSRVAVNSTRPSPSACPPPRLTARVWLTSTRAIRPPCVCYAPLQVSWSRSITDPPAMSRSFVLFVRCDPSSYYYPLPITNYQLPITFTTITKYIHLHFHYVSWCFFLVLMILLETPDIFHIRSLSLSLSISIYNSVSGLHSCLWFLECNYILCFRWVEFRTCFRYSFWLSITFRIQVSHVLSRSTLYISYTCHIYYIQNLYSGNCLLNPKKNDSGNSPELNLLW